MGRYFVSVRRGLRFLLFFLAASGDGELLHARIQRARFHIETFSRAVLAFDSPVGRLEGFQDVLTFGFGEHFCMGAHVARAQLRAIFDELLHQLPDIAVADPVYVPGNFLHAVRSMPCTF